MFHLHTTIDDLHNNKPCHTNLKHNYDIAIDISNRVQRLAQAQNAAIVRNTRRLNIITCIFSFFRKNWKSRWRRGRRGMTWQVWQIDSRQAGIMFECRMAGIMLENSDDVLFLVWSNYVLLLRSKKIEPAASWHNVNVDLSMIPRSVTKLIWQI